MRRISYLPWDLRSWRQAFQQSGVPGLAMLLLMLADTLALPTVHTHALHEDTTNIILFRLPLAALATFLVFLTPSFGKLRFGDLRYWFGISLFIFWASIAWSTSRVQTAGKAMEITVGFLIVLEATRGSEALVRLQAMLRLLMLCEATLALLTVLAYFTRLPEFVKQKPGFFTHTVADSSVFPTDSLGYFSVTLILVSTVEYMTRNIRLRQLVKELFFAGFIFAFSSSRSSLAIVAVGLFYILWRRSKLAAIVVSVAGIGVAIAFHSKIVKYLSFGQSTQSFDTLSGRLVLWLAAIQEWKRRPWFGYGGGVGGKWVIEHLADRYHDQMSFLHNGYLECLVGVGVVGFFFGMVVFILAIVRTLRLWRHYPQYSWIFIWIISFTLQTSVGPGVMSWMSDVMAMYLIFIVFLDVLQQNDRKWMRGKTLQHTKPEIDVYSLT